MRRFNLPVLKLNGKVAQWLTFSAWILLVVSDSLLIAMLAAGTRLDGYGHHAGDENVNLVQNYLVSMAVPFQEFLVTWPNGTVANRTNNLDVPWIITWHVSSVAAHPNQTFDTEVGAFIVHSSPAKPFNITYVLSRVGGIFEYSLWDDIDGLAEITWNDPQPSVVSLAALSVHMANVNMAGPCFLWGMQLGLSSLALLGLMMHPCCALDVGRRAKSERFRRARLRVFAAMTAIGAFFGFIFVVYMTAKAAWVVQQLRHADNAAFVNNVKFGSRAIGILWASWAAVLLACGLLVVLGLEERDVEERMSDANAVRLRQAFNTNGRHSSDIETDPPPPPYSATAERQPPKQEE